MRGVLVVRHAIAEDRVATDGGTDAERALTDEGRRKMTQAAQGLTRVLERLDHVAVSPLVRARQTGEILAAAFGLSEPEIVEALAPGHEPEERLRWLRDVAPERVAAAVGHEPDLGEWVSWLLTGHDVSFTPLKKGGACLLEVDDEPRPGRARLLWLMRPRELRRLAEVP